MACQARFATHPCRWVLQSRTAAAQGRSFLFLCLPALGLCQWSATFLTFRFLHVCITSRRMPSLGRSQTLSVTVTARMQTVGSSASLSGFWKTIPFLHSRGSRRDAEGRGQYRGQGLLRFLASLAKFLHHGFVCLLTGWCLPGTWSLDN